MLRSKLSSALVWMIFYLSALTLTSCSDSPSGIVMVQAPAADRYCSIDPTGESILPNGRIIRPQGKQVVVAPHPYGLVLSHDGLTAVTANSGIRPFCFTIIPDILEDSLRTIQVPSGPFGNRGILESVFMGLAFSPDDSRLYVSGGVANSVYIFDPRGGVKTDSIYCGHHPGDQRDYAHGYLGDMVMSNDGKMLYVVDQINFCVNFIDLDKKELTGRVAVGRYPFGITLSPDQKRLWVANVGMYEYSAIEGINDENYRDLALRKPAAAYLSEESEKGFESADGLKITGLGAANVPESFSVWAINLGDTVFVSAKIKTGILVGELIEGIPAVGGSSPNSLVATDNYVFVSNGNNDLISVIDTRSDSIIRSIRLTVAGPLKHLKGIIPFGLALSPDRDRLYVAEAGINAVGVIDAKKLELLGHIPAGWFPSKLQVTPDGRHLVVANAKGFGSGPNGGTGYTPGPEGQYIGNIMKGTVSVMEIPGRRQLANLTTQVIRNNFNISKYKADRGDNPIPAYPGEKSSPIKYIVFISKENRTYDDVFGRYSSGTGDPSLGRYGTGVSFTNNSQTAAVENASVMVNHLALAEAFAISDNFYVDSDVSADGHRWLTCTYPNEWTETSVAAAYGGKRSMRKDSEAPGNLAFVGSSGAFYPEDYNEAGSMWDQFARHDVSVYNFGFSVELAGSYEDSTMKYGGVRYRVNYPVPAPVFLNSSELYPTFNMAIPDQFRADIFIREYTEKWLDPGLTPPSFISVLLPNDHGAGDRPWAGYPFRESYMCDNDLALGRIIEFLSSTPYWKEMAVFVTEDDAQDGYDHIDAHRSILMVISPWARKNFVGHMHYSFGSIFKTFWNILGLPCLNQYDAGATDLSGLFTSEPDFTPFHALPVDPRIFDPQKALDPFDEGFDWKAVAGSPRLDGPEEIDVE